MGPRAQDRIYTRLNFTGRRVVHYKPARHAAGSARRGMVSPGISARPKDEAHSYAPNNPAGADCRSAADGGLACCWHGRRGARSCHLHRHWPGAGRPSQCPHHCIAGRHGRNTLGRRRQRHQSRLQRHQRLQMVQDRKHRQGEAERMGAGALSHTSQSGALCRGPAKTCRCAYRRRRGCQGRAAGCATTRPGGASGRRRSGGWR